MSDLTKNTNDLLVARNVTGISASEITQLIAAHIASIRANDVAEITELTKDKETLTCALEYTKADLAVAQNVAEESAEIMSDLRADLTALRSVVDRQREALETIAEGKGAFSRDPLIHAANTIEAMKECAHAALSPHRCLRCGEMTL